MSDFPSDEWAREVAARLNEDAEFARIAREFDATVRFDFGEDAYEFELGDGSVRSVRDATAFSSWDVALRAPMDTWETFLSESPPPFYNDLRSVWTQHDMTIEGDVLTAIQHWRPLKYLVDGFGEVHR